MKTEAALTIGLLASAAILAGCATDTARLDSAGKEARVAEFQRAARSHDAYLERQRTDALYNHATRDPANPIQPPEPQPPTPNPGRP